jgi:hypothetical protein
MCFSQINHATLLFWLLLLLFRSGQACVQGNLVPPLEDRVEECKKRRNNRDQTFKPRFAWMMLWSSDLFLLRRGKLIVLHVSWLVIVWSGHRCGIGFCVKSFLHGWMLSPIIYKWVWYQIVYYRNPKRRIRLVATVSSSWKLTGRTCQKNSKRFPSELCQRHMNVWEKENEKSQM